MEDIETKLNCTGKSLISPNKYINKFLFFFAY